MSKTFLQSMFQDGVDGSWSSRRIVTFLAFIFCSIAFFANLFFSYDIKEYIFEGMMIIAISGLGVTVAEKFVSRQSDNKTNPKYTRIKKTPLPDSYQKEQ